MLTAAPIAAFAISGPAQRAQAAPANTETKAETKKAAKAEKKANRKAAQTRQKQCGSEWKEALSAGKVETHMTWPKYYSECNKRLKEKVACSVRWRTEYPEAEKTKGVGETCLSRRRPRRLQAGVAITKARERSEVARRRLV